MMMDKKRESEQKLAKDYMIRRADLEQERSTYEPEWRDIGDYVDPRSYRFRGELIEEGKRKDEKIINITPRLAARTLASGMQSGITSPMRPWFRLALPDPDMNEYGPFKLWVGEVERIMRYIFSRSNIYDRLKSNYGTLGKYGTSALWIDEDADDIIRAHDFLIGTFYISQNAAGVVDTMYRETALTTTQMLERFGTERVSNRVRVAYDNGNYNQRFNVCHIVEPNRMYNPNSRLAHHKRYASVWIEEAGNMADGSSILSFKGYDHKPFMAPRWDVIGENVYGQGCGDIAIGDCKQLQLMEKRKLQGIDHNARPHMLADASMRSQRPNNVPGATTYVNGLVTGNPGYRRAFDVNPYINELREEIMRIEGHIEEAFFKNLFLMVTEMADQPNITATQINTMREEKLMMLGPVLERLNDELLDQLIDRTFLIAMKRGMIPPPPAEIAGQELKVEYISVMAQAQKAMGIGNIERFVGFVGNVSQLFPEARDKVNIDEIIDEYADGVAVPPKGVRTNEDVSGMRQERAQQEQQMQQMQAAAASAETAKTLSETDLSGDNAVTRAMEIAGV